MKRSRATHYCEATPGCINYATHKAGECIVPDPDETTPEIAETPGQVAQTQTEGPNGRKYRR